MASSRELPVGTVTLMFCDIEGSTALARALGDGWPEVLGAHRAILRSAVGAHGGIELGIEGDGMIAAFPRAGDAVAAAAGAQRALAAHRWPAGVRVLVRIGLHTGEPTLTVEGYEGLDMHRGARVMAAGHGGQVLLTSAARATAGERLTEGVTVEDLGEHVLRDFPQPEHVFQLLIEGLRTVFPPLRAAGGSHRLTMQFRVLGPLEVVTDDATVDVGAGKRRALLAHLIIHANEVVSAERLIDELWGEHPPATAAKSVHVYVSQLRKALSANGEMLATRGSGYVINVEPDQVDSLLFEQRLATAQQELADGDAASASREARRALELWRGPALFDFAYESFAQTEAARLDELRLVALETRIEADLALGEHSRVASELESLVAEHPLRERFRAQLMLALYRSGRQSEALDAYHEGRRLLLDELGIEPSPELRELEQGILVQSDELAAPRRRSRSKAELPPPTASVVKPERRRERRAAWLIAAGATVVLGAAVAGIAQRAGSGGSEATVAIDSAPNSMVVVDPVRSRPVAAVPLAGRPTDAAAGAGRVWVTTTDSPSLTSIDARTRKIVRTIPLRDRPEAVAFGAGSVWIAGGNGRVLARVRPGYGSFERRFRFPSAPAPPVTANRMRVPRATLAAGGGAIWLTNGSATLFRVDPGNNRPERITAGRRLDAVASGAGAIWALAGSTATVLRVDPLTKRITDRIPIVARHGPDLPAPTGIAAGADAVWVLNGNSATVTRINPETRGVEMTIELGIDRVPADIAATGHTAWIANFDGSLSRVGRRSSTPNTVWVGGSLERVVATPSTVWTTTTALDQKLPGGSD